MFGISNTFGSMDALYNAQQGVSQNVKSVEDASGKDLMEQIPQQIVAQNGVESNAKSMQTQDEMYKTLLDIKA